jgi:hypothetical protein
LLILYPATFAATGSTAMVSGSFSGSALR